MRYMGLATALLVTATAEAAGWTVGQTVQTSSGPVQGHAASNASEVSEYLGIPYAMSPLGERRFQPPVRYEDTATINGSSFGFTCYQAASGILTPEIAALLNITEAGLVWLNKMGQHTDFNEDCLTLNIWTKPQAGETKKPVLFWIHGGGFIEGGSSIPYYNGEFIADETEVVLVSINYRLGVFGFPGNPTSPPNLGLLDQRMALEWTRDNIANFGGDPDRITLFGESSGSISADLHTYGWPSDPIANGFITQSGTASSFGALNKTAASKLWYNVSSVVGCGGADADPDQVFACVSTKPAADLIRAQEPLVGPQNLLNTEGMQFGPTADEEIVFLNLTGHTPAARPMLIGNNDNEAGLFKALYPDPTLEEIWSMVNLLFVCPAGARSSENVELGNPTWRYRYMGVFPNTMLKNDSSTGAYHASEISVLFGTSPTSVLPNTDEEIAIGKYMRGAWAAFAKDPTNGLLSYEDGWPRYSTEEDTLIRIGFQNKTGANEAKGDEYDEQCVGIPTVTSPTGTMTTASGATSTATGSENLGSRLVRDWQFGGVMLAAAGGLAVW